MFKIYIYTLSTGKCIVQFFVFLLCCNVVKKVAVIHHGEVQ